MIARAHASWRSGGRAEQPRAFPRHAGLSLAALSAAPQGLSLQPGKDRSIEEKQSKGTKEASFDE